MRKLTTFIILLLAIVVHAQQITPDEAAAIASEFLNSSASHLTRTEHIGVKRAKTRLDADEKLPCPYYVFNGDDKQGFVIVSGDKRAKKILGYSDTGSFNFENMPPQLKGLLEQYTEQIKSLADEAGIDPSWNTQISRSTENGGVLLETANWGQGYPYNLQTPVIDGEHCPTGCVATAMAIVMKYHNWPENGRGEHHYTSFIFNPNNGNKIEETLTAKYENTYYDYSTIPTETNDFTISESIDAVSSLMKDVGISVDMRYGIDGSGASNWDIPYAMKEYFKYDKDCQLIARKNFQDSEWNHLIINQIDKGYPIIYLGTNSQLGGHAFVLDGYDESMNYFHFNWGWEGGANGYYTLEATDDNTMIAFNKEQAMVINLIPDHFPREYSRATVEYPHRLAGDNNLGLGLNVNVPEIKSGEPFDINTNILVLPSEFCGWYGYAIVDKEEHIKEIVWESNKECVDYGRELCPSTQVSGAKISLTSEELDETDRLQVITRYDGEDVWRIVPGTLEAPSSCPISGNKPELSHIVLDIDDALEIYLSTNLYFYNYGCSENDRIEEKEYSPISGTTVFYRIVTKEAKPDYVITFDIDGFFNGEQMNRVRTTTFEKDEICGFFDINKYTFNITAKYQKPLIMNIQTHKGGELSELINQDEARIVSNLTISGPLNAYDMWYMNDYFQSLTVLDISNTYFEETFIENPPQYNASISWTQSADQLPDVSFWELKKLQTVKLPDYLKYIGHNCFQLAYSIKRFELPKNIERIGVNLLFECINLEQLYSLNPNPPIFMGEIGNFWNPHSFERVKVFVPIGAKEKYQTAPVWNRFVNIEEFDPVISVLAESLTVTPESWTGEEGESFTLVATVLPDNATDKTVTWSSSDETVATVDTNGKVTALAVGEAIITATAADGSGISASCKVTVGATPAESITLSQTATQLKTGESITLTATVLPDNATDKTVTWSSSDKTVVTVDANGKVTAIAIGEATITATCGSVSASCKVTVGANTVESITLSQATAQLKTSESITLTATVLPENATDKTVTWSSSDKTVATVDANGKVTAIAIGEATITATCGNVSASCKVTVLPILAESLTVTPESWTGEEGESFTLVATVLPENATDKSVSWSSSDPEIATVDADGNVSVLKSGYCVITVSTQDGSNLSAKCTITGVSGIDDIFTDADARFGIYSLQGILIKKDCSRDDLRQLSPGAYILWLGNVSKKIIIR